MENRHQEYRRIAHDEAAKARRRLEATCLHAEAWEAVADATAAPLGQLARHGATEAIQHLARTERAQIAERLAEAHRNVMTAEADADEWTRRATEPTPAPNLSAAWSEKEPTR